MGMSQQVALGRGLALVLFRLAKSESSAITQNRPLSIT